MVIVNNLLVFLHKYEKSLPSEPRSDETGIIKVRPLENLGLGLENNLSIQGIKTVRRAIINLP